MLPTPSSGKQQSRRRLSKIDFSLLTSLLDIDIQQLKLHNFREAKTVDLPPQTCKAMIAVFLKFFCRTFRYTQEDKAMLGVAFRRLQ
ncbi:hypothetical protein EMIT0194P_10438 [Pseudomonas serbica]